MKPLTTPYHPQKDVLGHKQDPVRALHGPTPILFIILLTLSTLPSALRPTELLPGPWSLPDHFMPQGLPDLPTFKVWDLAVAILRSFSGPSHYIIAQHINNYVGWISK